MAKRSFGQITKLPSNHYRARYTGPDARLHNAPHTFDTRLDAEAWLTDERRLISSGTWMSPLARTAQRRAGRALTFAGYANRWLEQRDLKPRTRATYRSLLDRLILPTFAAVPLKEIGSEQVRDWYSSLDPSKKTLRAHAYGLLRAILETAVTDEKIAANPCHIRGAGTVKRARVIKPASLSELELLVTSLPAKYQLMALLGSWCALRFGELIELRRRDIDLNNAVIHVRRGAVRANGKVIIDTPKSEAGVRDVAVPPHLVPFIREHVSANTSGGRDGLLFPAADGKSTLAPATLYRVYYRAREAAGRPDLRFHDLRHTGAVLAAQTGATLAELMGRLGHSTPGAALLYQHVAQGRDAQIASALSAMASRRTPRK